MKRAEAQSLYKAMLPHLPQFVTDGRKLLLIAPIGHTLRALVIDSSSYSREDFYFHWFFMPICVSTDYVTLSYGDRLKAPNGTEGWNTNIPDLPMRMVEAVEKQALPQLLKLDSVDDVVAAMRARVGDNIHALREVAYLQVLQGKFETAEVALRKIIAKEEIYSRQWEKDIVIEAQLMVNDLNSLPSAAVEKVKTWQDQTLKNLKLEAWR